MRDRESTRAYIRSPRFQILSWGSFGVAIASFFVPQYGLYLALAAVLVGAAATGPLWSLVRPRNREIDFGNRRDRITVLLVAVFVLMLLALSSLAVYWR